MNDHYKIIRTDPKGRYELHEHGTPDIFAKWVLWDTAFDVKVATFDFYKEASRTLKALNNNRNCT